eukprot:7449237-Pyramimonas_sp.AAC.1
MGPKLGTRWLCASRTWSAAPPPCLVATRFDPEVLLQGPFILSSDMLQDGIGLRDMKRRRSPM